MNDFQFFLTECKSLLPDERLQYTKMAIAMLLAFTISGTIMIMMTRMSVS